MNAINDRRRYYRINDTVLLRYIAAKDGESTDDDTEVDNTKLSAGILLGKSDRELNDAIEHVYSRDPAFAKVLELLNRKISALATQVLGAEEFNVDAYDKAQVNLSGCGIAFIAREPWSVGKRLKIGLLLKPAQVPVELYGTIISVDYEDGDTESCRVRVDFDENEHSQDQIIQYVVQRQGALLSDSARSRGN